MRMWGRSLQLKHRVQYAIEMQQIDETSKSFKFFYTRTFFFIGLLLVLFLPIEEKSIFIVCLFPISLWAYYCWFNSTQLLMMWRKYIVDRFGIYSSEARNWVFNVSFFHFNISVFGKQTYEIRNRSFSSYRVYTWGSQWGLKLRMWVCMREWCWWPN